MSIALFLGGLNMVFFSKKKLFLIEKLIKKKFAAF